MIARLRAVGYRMTAQRRALLATIWGFEGHFTVEQVRDALSAVSPPVDTSTIYRTLELLCEMGVLHALTGHSPTEYERPREPHHHLICTICGTVTALSAYHLDDLFRHLREQHQFEADLAHLAIPGRCHQCRTLSPQGD